MKQTRHKKQTHPIWYVLVVVIVIAFVLAGWMFFTITAAFITGTTSVTGKSATGTVKAANNPVSGTGVGIYSDSACTKAVTNIAWGTLNPGSSKSFLVYIKNTGNGAGIIQFITNNWTPPSAANYLSMTWDYSGVVINASKVIPVHLTLTVSSSIAGKGITTFTNNIIFSAIRYTALDINGDGRVDLGDLTTVSKYYGQTVPPAPSNADLNGDGKVGLPDLTLISNYYGKLVW